MRRTLHCVAFGREGASEAICLDLDVAAQGRTFDAASASLRTAIELYLETLADLPADEPARRLRRRVPLLTRLRYAARASLMAFGRGDSGVCEHQHTMPLPA
jgi:hypothetical protein